MAMTAYAAEWKQNDIGWWWENDDGTYPVNQWSWINDRCYYFDENGYCLINTVTPDGFTVDETGAWIKDGVVQTQSQEAEENVIQVGQMNVRVPAGITFLKFSSGEIVERAHLSDDKLHEYRVEHLWNGERQSAFTDILIQDFDGNSVLHDGQSAATQRQILDRNIVNWYGKPLVADYMKNSDWILYFYTSDSSEKMPGGGWVMARISDFHLQVVTVDSNVITLDSDFDAGEFVKNNIW